MKRMSSAGVILLYLLVAMEGRAATTSFTIDQAVRLALAHAPEMEAARHDLSAAKHRQRQAWSAHLPRMEAKVSYVARYPKNELPLDFSGLSRMADTVSKLTGETIDLPQIGDIDSVHHFRAGVEVGYRLLDFSRGAMVDAARAANAASSAGYREAETKLAFRVRATFLAALFARDVKQISAEALKLSRAQEQRAELRAKVGTGSQIALAQARVRVAELKARHRQADNELARHRAQLASLVRLNALPPLTGDLETFSRAPRVTGAKNNPALAGLTAARKAARHQASSSRRGWIPTLNLFVRGEVEYPHVMKTEWGPLFTGGAQLRWPFFTGGQRGSRTAEAEARARKLGALHRAASADLKRRLIDLGARRRAAEADLTSAKETLTQNQVYLRVARAALTTGTGTELDVHRAELGRDRANIAVRKAFLSMALVSSETLAVGGIVHRGETR